LITKYAQNEERGQKEMSTKR